MIGRQLGILPSQPPNWIATEPSGALLGRDVVERIGVEVVLLEIALAVVEADRPEAIDRHIFDVELVDCLAVVLRGSKVEIDARPFSDCRPRSSPPKSDAGRDRLASFVPKARLVSVSVVPSTISASRIFFWLTGSHFGSSNLPGPPGCSTLIASCNAWTLFDVFRIGGIDQRSYPDEHVARSHLLSRERVLAGARSSAILILDQQSATT